MYDDDDNENFSWLNMTLYSVNIPAMIPSRDTTFSSTIVRMFLPDDALGNSFRVDNIRP